MRGMVAAALFALACGSESEPSDTSSDASAGAGGVGGVAGSGAGSGGTAGTSTTDGGGAAGSGGAAGASGGTAGAASGGGGAGTGGVPPYATGCGACGEPRGAAIGGGQGYPWLIGKAQAKVVVGTKVALLSAIASAQAGDVIYVDDAAEIDLSDTHDIVVPGGVTLASGRGNAGSQGALLFNAKLALSAGGSKVWSWFSTGGPGIRFTGFRLRGSDTEIHSQAYELDNYRGISIAHDDCEVDNMQLWGWSHYAIGVTKAKGIDVHHNHIHHNRRAGLGYGVVVTSTSNVLIEGNEFDANRHSVAGGGGIGPSYEARYNWVGPTANGHVFDMHGDGTVSKGNGGAAGYELLIHHNTATGSSQELVVIRGVPVKGAFIEHNSMPHASAATAIVQSYGTGNFHVADNCFGTTKPICD